VLSIGPKKSSQGRMQGLGCRTGLSRQVVAMLKIVGPLVRASEWGEFNRKGAGQALARVTCDRWRQPEDLHGIATMKSNF
jgi:hypothetical protein